MSEHGAIMWGGTTPVCYNKGEVSKEKPPYIVKSKHIKAELDFIPVEERLPNNGRPVFGIERSSLPGISLSAYISEMMYVENLNMPLELPSSWWLPTGLKPCWPVTHWAEIPTFKEKTS